MNGNGINILDLILGAIQPTSGQTDSNKQVSSDGLPFDLILSQFTEGAEGEIGVNDTQVLPSDNDLLNSEEPFDILALQNPAENDLGSEVDVQAESTRSFSTKEEITPIVISSLPQSIQSSVNIDQVDNSIIDAVDKLSNLDFADTNDLKIVDWSLSENKQSVNLTIQNNTDTTFNISLPVENLDFSGVDDKRVSLEAMLDKKSSVRNLFEKLNLKEIQIETISNTDDNTEVSKRQIDNVKIVADVQGQEKLIPIKISLNDKLTTVGVAEASDSDSVDVRVKNKSLNTQTSTSPILPNGQSPSRYVTSQIKRPVAVADNTGFFEGKQKDTKAQPKGFSLDSTKAHSEFLNSVYSEKGSSRTSDKTVIVTQRPIQFELPESAKSILKPNGHSVQLRINPEHLGPARLSLTMVNDQLRAVVVVDNSAARHALEGSIDRLVDTLAKAGISVDSIAVNIDGESAKEQLFDQSPRFSRKIQSVGRNVHDPISNDEVIQPHKQPLRMEHYVSAHGVNLVA